MATEGFLAESHKRTIYRSGKGEGDLQGLVGCPEG